METALSLVILLFVATAGLNFGDAMVVRSRLTHGVGHAARVCALGTRGGQLLGGLNACVEQQARAVMDTMAGRCNGLAVNSNIEQIATDGGAINIVQVEARCPYNGGVWGGMVDRYVNRPLILSARTSMPLGPVGP
ncbi:hypothetical protein KKF91_20540 [Myxococcota bacterium]|nr:hypothetical protein [Myxococcota bacterium]MBU1432934.1 hypothetical protein [Myxococcota bacterium]MBU1896236.1 hypothetical protein [Myxococcota bacterium]